MLSFPLLDTYCVGWYWNNPWKSSRRTAMTWTISRIKACVTLMCGSKNLLATDTGLTIICFLREKVRYYMVRRISSSEDRPMILCISSSWISCSFAAFERCEGCSWTIGTAWDEETALFLEQNLTWVGNRFPFQRSRSASQRKNLIVVRLRSCVLFFDR